MRQMHHFRLVIVPKVKDNVSDSEVVLIDNNNNAVKLTVSLYGGGVLSGFVCQDGDFTPQQSLFHTLRIRKGAELK